MNFVLAKANILMALSKGNQIPKDALKIFIENDNLNEESQLIDLTFFAKFSPDFSSFEESKEYFKSVIEELINYFSLKWTDKEKNFAYFYIYIYKKNINQNFLENKNDFYEMKKINSYLINSSNLSDVSFYCVYFISQKLLQVLLEDYQNSKDEIFELTESLNKYNDRFTNIEGFWQRR